MVNPRAQAALLEHECRVWCRYLIDQQPSPAVVARYREAHEQGVVEVAPHCARFDRALVRIAQRGPFAARCCDAHARLFSRAGLLRRKLVLTLALLETDAAHHARVDEVTAGSRLGFFAHCVALAFGFALLSFVGLFLFFPLRAWCAIDDSTGGRA